MNKAMDWRKLAAAALCFALSSAVYLTEAQIGKAEATAGLAFLFGALGYRSYLQSSTVAK